jgi:hypothetical protein
MSGSCGHRPGSLRARIADRVALDLVGRVTKVASDGDHSFQKATACPVLTAKRRSTWPGFPVGLGHPQGRSPLDPVFDGPSHDIHDLKASQEPHESRARRRDSLCQVLTQGSLGTLFGPSGRGIARFHARSCSGAHRARGRGHRDRAQRSWRENLTRNAGADAADRPRKDGAGRPRKRRSRRRSP